ncbi:MAG: tRNA threonylcarbamoyladenosine biosynthesis protein [bacterium]|nr:MAG: tRNA threonylcarbamoyladenosine biosynthesis protein [bacterium]KAF0147433.1 MAG: tRNA threonylcarbamoyladenosine biosynthesis protein [bacterium]KAF0166290.1 MAG: tRNA threonylcarbamoyladenosine biosynthesis protein [bacterium]TXT16441.1 MAG: tRNA threonylcarbamoyladenosine biosynthesis protein [bacterium]
MTPLPPIRRILAFLRRGGVIAYPTESCYGLGCDPRNAGAVARILRLKGRPRNKGLILIGADCHQFKPYLAPNPREILRRFGDWWPGPTTLLLPKGRRCPRWLLGRHEKMAVRVTAHAEAARLCHFLGMPLVSTSANLAGRRPLRTAAECRRQFGARVLVLEGRVGRRKRPSTILDPYHGGVVRP